MTEQLRFGHGGGFTGAVTEYCLTSKGVLYKQEMGTLSKLKVDKEEAAQCFAKCKAIQFTEIEVTNPSNFYAFIAHHQQDSVHRVDWNPHHPTLSTDLRDFHNMLLALVGEAPITVTPEPTVQEGDKLIQRSATQKLKRSAESPSTSDKKLKLKQLNHKKVKKNKM